MPTLFSAGRYLLLCLLAASLAAPAAAQFTVEPLPMAPGAAPPATPFQGRPVRITLDQPTASVKVVWRPNSAIPDTVSLDPTGTTFEWTPTRAGVASIVTPEGSQNVSVRYSSYPATGIFILIVAGTILFGGARLCDGQAARRRRGAAPVPARHMSLRPLAPIALLIALAGALAPAATAQFREPPPPLREALLAPETAAPDNGPPPDPWLGIDKAQHFTFSALFVLAGQYVLTDKAGLSDGRALPIACAGTLALGLAKEVADANRPRRPLFSWRDLAADAAGVAVGAAVVAL